MKMKVPFFLSLTPTSQFYLWKQKIAFEVQKP